MKSDYTAKELKLINSLLTKINSINSLKKRIINNIDETTIIQIGNNAEEKLFLLNVLLEDIIKEENLKPVNASVLNENVIDLIESLNRILQEKELVYSVNIMDFPGIKLPCSSLSEAKRVARQLNVNASIYFKDQVVL